MGLTKNLPYSQFQNDAALVGRALGHPVRIKLVSLLSKNCYNRTQLKSLTGLSLTAIRNHLLILDAACLLTIIYEEHQLIFSLDKDAYKSSLELLAECPEALVTDEESVEKAPNPVRTLFPFFFRVRTLPALPLLVLTCWCSSHSATNFLKAFTAIAETS